MTYFLWIYKIFHSLQSAAADYKAFTISLLTCHIDCMPFTNTMAYRSYVVCLWSQLSCRSEIQNRIQSIDYTSIQLCCYKKGLQWLYREVSLEFREENSNPFEGNISTLPCIKYGCKSFSTPTPIGRVDFSSS